ncbi:hypothetical protein EMST110833_12460 [Empedobacter stercoris]
MTHNLTNDELNQKLTEKIALLKLSVENYEKGHEFVVQQISTDIRTLVHDTFYPNGNPNSKSLLSHLEIKDKISFYDTTLSHEFKSSRIKDYMFPNFSHTFNADGIILKPIKFEQKNFLMNNFEGWWKGNITKYKDGQIISRERLILDQANKDGGAHIDKNLKLGEEYSKVTRGDHFMFEGINSLGQNINQKNSPEKPLIYIIAKELISSLEDFQTGIDEIDVTTKTLALKNIANEIENSKEVQEISELTVKKFPVLANFLNIPISLNVNHIKILLHLEIYTIQDINNILSNNYSKFEEFVIKEMSVNPIFSQFLKLEDLIFQFIYFINKDKFIDFNFAEESNSEIYKTL